MEFDYQKTIHNGKNGYELYKDNNIKRFHWDIITLCNYHCEYCYSRNNDYQWNKMTSKKDVDIIISKLQEVNDKVELVLLGGEPTKHPHYFYILDNLYNLNNHLIAFGIITNGVFKDEEQFIKKHSKYIDKFYFNVTFHPSQIEDILTFKNTLLLLKENHFIINVNIMLVDEKWNDTTIDILTFCKEHNFRYYFNVIFDYDNESFMNNTTNYKKWLVDINIKFGEYKDLQYSNNNKVEVHNDIDTYLYDLSDFQNWKCKNNNYNIPVQDTKFTRFCNEEELTVGQLNETEQYIICPLKQCVCQGKLMTEKIRNEN